MPLVGPAAVSTGGIDGFVIKETVGSPFLVQFKSRIIYHLIVLWQPIGRSEAKA